MTRGNHHTTAQREQLAAQWIVSLLRSGNIPFLICGGLAAKGYGASRPLHDIDLFVPAESFAQVVAGGQAFISKPARRYKEEGWDLEYVQFLYEGVKIEVGNASGASIYDVGRQVWTELAIDFSRYRPMTLLGLELPMMQKEDLIQYKTMLGRVVDEQDIREMLHQGDESGKGKDAGR
ncbi:nucleotidyltransferase family protein [Billgrantia desiderata]|uniref:nucleotidyltransferase family protein n=1 Tax=Billgrantia desiderata TaxID=52021 RepID=UPI001F4149CB